MKINSWMPFCPAVLCCSSASSLCDRRQHHHWLHESFIQPKLPVRCKGLSLKHLLSLLANKTAFCLYLYKENRWVSRVSLRWNSTSWFCPGSLTNTSRRARTTQSERGFSKVLFAGDVSLSRCFCSLCISGDTVIYHLKLPQVFTSVHLFNVCCLFPATNLTAGTVYEVAVWVHTSIGDSPTALSHHQTTGTQPERPVLKARALNQTAVDCSWTIRGPPAQVQHAPEIHTTDLKPCEWLLGDPMPFHHLAH